MGAFLCIGGGIMTQEQNTQENTQEQVQAPQYSQEDIARLQAENANLKTQASEWQGAAQQYYSAYQQAVAQGQTPAQAQNTAAQTTGVTQNADGSFATVDDLKATVKGVLKEELSGLQQEYTQQQQWNQTRQTIDDYIGKNYDFYDKSIDSKELLQTVHERAALKMYQGVPFQTAYLESLKGLATVKVNPQMGVPQAQQIPGQSNYGGHISAPPSGIDGALAQAELEYNQAKEKFYSPGGRTLVNEKTLLDKQKAYRGLQVKMMQKI